jgi:hypothetical protein
MGLIVTMMPRSMAPRRMPLVSQAPPRRPAGPR